MREYLKMFRKMDYAEALEKSESGDGGVDVEAGSKTGAEDEAESFERAHGCSKNGGRNHRQISKYHERA